MTTWTLALTLMAAFSGHAGSADTATFPLWDTATPLPKAADLPRLSGVEFYVIKPYEFDKDGYRFLHGVALAWHQGRLYASFGHNKGGENTDTEEDYQSGKGTTNNPRRLVGCVQRRAAAQGTRTAANASRMSESSRSFAKLFGCSDGPIPHGVNPRLGDAFEGRGATWTTTTTSRPIRGLRRLAPHRSSAMA